MKTLLALIRRNVKLFFRDKGTFFTAMITPLILLVLFVSFLGDVYRDSLLLAIPAGMAVSESVTEGFVGGWLFSSLLATCCVTVAFCSNMIMVEDRSRGARRDLEMTPVRSSVLALSYYLSTALTTTIICFISLGIGFLYLSVVGWYLSVTDVILCCLDVLLLVIFGTALSSVIVFFLSTQGQIAAVGSIVSSCYGFVCGAYMPISQFSEGIQTVISCLPGTYGTGLLRRHLMGGALRQMETEGLPSDVTREMADAFDNQLYFFDHAVGEGEMYAVLGVTVAVLIVIYVLFSRFLRKPVKVYHKSTKKV